MDAAVEYALLDAPDMGQFVFNGDLASSPGGEFMIQVLDVIDDPHMLHKQ